MSSSRWSGRLAIVTGASAGIGAAICRSLVGAGMVVAGLARRADRVEELSAQLSACPGKLHAFECDITDDGRLAEVFKQVTKQHGPVYLCVNNAGLNFNKSLTDGSPKEWRTMMDVNVIALTYLTQLSIANMRDNKVPGHVIHISSILGHAVVGIDNLSFYTATKFAVRALTEAMRLEVKDLKPKIRISSISPGMVETEFLAVSGIDKGDAGQIFLSNDAMKASDIADTLMHMLNAPDSVEIQDVLIQPNSPIGVSMQF